MKTTIATVKNEFRLTEWSAQIQAQKSSGLTVHKWCEENGVNVKTDYYHLRKGAGKMYRNCTCYRTTDRSKLK